MTLQNSWAEMCQTEFKNVFSLQMKMKNKLLRYEKFCNHDICGVFVFNTHFLPLCLTCMREVNVINA